MKYAIIVFLFISSFSNGQHLLPQPKEVNFHETKISDRFIKYLYGASFEANEDYVCLLYTSDAADE